MDTMQMILKGIPGEIKRNFHAACAQNDISMKQVIVLCMKNLGDPDRMLKFLLAMKKQGEI